MEDAIKEVFNTEGMSLSNKIIYYAWLLVFTLLLMAQVVILVLQLAGLINLDWAVVFVPFFCIMGQMVFTVLALVVHLFLYS